ncbi:MAG: hypothetical protein L0211_25335 [Planctomycetaceae bacterium]|nr:hypothetical protein [Planctomycetaceae bacterium]
MRLGHWRMAVMLGLATLAGCRAAPFVNSHIETVNGEYRQLEDYVYSLEEEVDRLHRELDDCKTARPASGDRTPREPGGLFRRRLRTPPGSESPELTPPTIDPGTPADPSGGAPSTPSETPPRRSTLNRPAGEESENLDLETPTVELPAPRGAEPTPAAPARPESLPPATPADTKVTHVFLNPIMTGGSNLDSRPGDDGLSIVIEPRNAADQYVPQAGAVSIVVLDPSKAGEEARVVRWDFDRSAAEQKLKTSSAARGIQLQMPWPATPPSAEKLHLFVRYEAADGRKLQTDREIFLTPPGQLSERWTPRPADRQRPAAIAHPAEPPPQIAQQPKPAAPTSAAPNLLTPPAWSPYR